MLISVSQDSSCPSQVNCPQCFFLCNVIFSTQQKSKERSGARFRYTDRGVVGERKRNGNQYVKVNFLSQVIFIFPRVTSWV